MASWHADACVYAMRTADAEANTNSDTANESIRMEAAAEYAPTSIPDDERSIGGT